METETEVSGTEICTEKESACSSQETKPEDVIEKEDVKLESDPYFYTKRNEFTSEIYKIEINGLPQRFGYGQLKKLLNSKLKLNSHKIKGPSNPNNKWAFVTFRCENDRERALTTLEGYKWKGKILSVKKANPAADPLVKKRSSEGNDAVVGNKKAKIEEDESLTECERLKNAVSPLWQMPYDKQLEKKESEMRRLLVTFGRKVKETNGDVDWLQRHREKHGLCCALNPIRSSPITREYRNKCEFNVGLASDGQTRNVGFRLASYCAGSMTVAECGECDIVPEAMKKVARCFQDYIRKSDKPPFNPENHSGYWRHVTVRITRNQHVMIIVVMHPQNLSSDELKVIKHDLKSYFKDGSGQTCGVTSMFFQPFAKKISKEDPPIEHLYGETHICETMCGLKFRISPDAFFQSNSAATEVLFDVIKSMIGEGNREKTTILDVCCGTGTIGITLAADVAQVIGIEMVPSAIEDATENAKLNDLQNVKFLCGKAEDMMRCALSNVENGNEIVAIVDPPRAGLHNRVVRTLRACPHIKRLIYVSCNPKMALLNFEDLTRPISNQYSGPPFIPVSATPVDLFPDTDHCELVVLFEHSSRV